LKEVDAETLTDFLVVAAKLLLIKSQALLPRPPGAFAEGEDDEDVGTQLARQLTIYKQFKLAAQTLSARQADHLTSFVRVALTVPIEPRLVAGEVTVLDLVNAARVALAVLPPDPAVDEVVSPMTVTIGQQMARIQQWLERCPRVMFSQLMQDCASRLEIILTFMALLELIKQNLVDVRQDTLFGDIVITGTARRAA
jgi:segregation and condensation protein A